MVDQLTVFLENEEGRLAKLCRAMGEVGVNMKALTIADTAEYGVVRIICDDARSAKAALAERGYRAMVTRVSAVAVPNRPGGLAELLAVFDDLDIAVDYGYCFSMDDNRAVVVLKVAGDALATRAAYALEQAGFHVLDQDEIA